MQDSTASIKSFSKEVWIGWISSLSEAYNMAIYSFIAPLLAPLLFQHTSAWRAIFFSYALVFIGFCLLYPLGAFYYGYMGDKQGRQKTCIYSTLGLALTTGLMGFIPYDFLPNIWILFLILICIQYFFSGGEYHGSIVFSLEHAGQKQSGLMSALSCVFAVIGLLSANGLATLAFLKNDLFWIRICFLVGGAGGIISYILKYYCRETPAFLAIGESFKTEGWINFIKQHKREISKVVILLAFFIVSYTFIFIFLPLTYLNQTTSQSFDTFKSLIIYGVMLVVCGILADKFGIEKMMLIGAAAFSFAIIPLFLFCQNLLLVQIILTVCACFVIGPTHSWILHQFAARNRCRGIFISSAIAMSIFGGSTVPICLIIFAKSGSLAITALYPLIFSLSLCKVFSLARSSAKAN